MTDAATAATMIAAHRRSQLARDHVAEEAAWASYIQTWWRWRKEERAAADGRCLPDGRGRCVPAAWEDELRRAIARCTGQKA